MNNSILSPPKIMLIVLVFVTASLFGQHFQGSISLVHRTPSDTVLYKYIVSENFVRISEIVKNKEVGNYVIVNIEESLVYEVNPSKKLYAILPFRPISKVDTTKYRVKKTGNFHDSVGYTCYQHIVTNVNEKHQVQYWLAEDNFHFSLEFFRLMCYRNRINEYILQIKDLEGKFPMHYEEHTILREFRMRMSVLEIKKYVPDAKLFVIPIDYQLFVQHSLLVR